MLIQVGLLQLLAAKLNSKKSKMRWIFIHWEYFFFFWGMCSQVKGRAGKLWNVKSNKVNVKNKKQQHQQQQQQEWWWNPDKQQKVIPTRIR